MPKDEIVTLNISSILATLDPTLYPTLSPTKEPSKWYSKLKQVDEGLWKLTRLSFPHKALYPTLEPWVTRRTNSHLLFLGSILSSTFRATDQYFGATDGRYLNDANTFPVSCKYARLIEPIIDATSLTLRERTLFPSLSPWERCLDCERDLSLRERILHANHWNSLFGL